MTARQPVGYDPEFLFSYRPNDSFYLSQDERAQLREAGRAGVGEQPAGTYAKRILNRLLIDLSWNSSRLEGNTYSLLDTWRLIEAGEVAEGKDRRDAQMILNHKSAIEFLVDAAEDIGFDRYTIFNLHAALAENLLPDPDAPGRLRRSGVGIHGSVFHPLEAPQLVEECFGRLLASAAAIEDPFEQAFFTMVHFPYLQAFDDVNKRCVPPGREHPAHQGESRALVVRGRAAGPLHGSHSRRLRTAARRTASRRVPVGRTGVRPPATVRYGSRWASPIRSGCGTGRRCAKSSAP